MAIGRSGGGPRLPFDPRLLGASRFRSRLPARQRHRSDHGHALSRCGVAAARCGCWRNADARSRLHLCRARLGTLCSPLRLNRPAPGIGGRDGAHPRARLGPVGTLTRPQTGAVSRQARLSCAPGLVHNRSSQDSARRQCQERPLDPWGNAERPMSNTTFFPVPDEVAESAWIDAAKYERMYAESISDPERFWAEHGRRIDWIKPFTKVK